MKIKLTKSEIIEKRLRFQGKPISFKNYPLSKLIIDAVWPIKMLIGGRQISKSFTLMGDDCSDIMGYSYKTLMYVAPTVAQAKVYSNDKINDRIRESPDFKKWYVDKDCINNVFFKTFRNQSKMYFKASSQTDSIRGMSINKIKYDEIQNMQNEDIMVIDETMSAMEKPEKWYAGTPLTIQNIIHSHWESSQKITPILICPAGHHQPPYLYNIKKDGVRCCKCNEKIDVRTAYFKRMGPKDAKIMAFWIPQIVLPLHAENPEKWADLYEKFCTYPKEKFLNEVMGQSAGQGIYLATEPDIIKCCKMNNGDSYPMWEEYHQLRGYASGHGIGEMWASIDWGVTNRVSFTVLIVGGWDVEENRFRVVFAKKYLEPDPIKVNDDLCYNISKYNVKKIVADWGAGHVANRLIEIGLNMPVMRVQYAGEKIPVHWDETAGMYRASRSLTLVNTFTQIKEHRFLFYDWEQFKEFAPHILAEYFEVRNDVAGNNLLKFDHPVDKPDDFLQALNILYNIWAFERAPYRIFQ